MKKYILFIIALFSAVTSFAEDTYVQYQGVTYKVTSGTDVTIYQDSSNVKTLSKVIKIPASFSAIPVNGTESATYTVKGLGYWKYGNAVSLNLYDTAIETITNLQNVLNSNVDTLMLPKTLANISWTASTSSGGVKYLAAVKVHEDNANFSATDGVLFNIVTKSIVLYPYRKTEVVYTVPEGIEKIGNVAFYDNDKLEKIVLPSTLKTIGNKAFYSCDYLADVNFPESLTSIGEYAFYENKLNPENSNFVLPGSLSTIGQYAFYNAFAYNSKTSVEFPTTLGQSGSYVNVGSYAFNCQVIRAKMTDPSVSDSYAFYYVNTIYVPKGYKTTYTAKQGWGYNNSSVANKIKESTTSTENPAYDRVATPTIKETISGTTMNLSFATTTEGATIRYKIGSANDNTDPVDWDIYDDTAKGIEDGQTVRVIAIKEGMNDSEIKVKSYDFSTITCKKPSINFNQTDTIISITTATEGADIYYTSDGSVPSKANGIKYDPTTKIIPVANNVTYKAIAVSDNMFDSSISDECYTSSFFTCPSVLFNQVVENGTAKIKIKLADSTKVNTTGMQIRYSTYSSYYESEFKDYKEPVALDDGNTIWAYVKKDGYNNSSTLSKQMSYSDSTWVACTTPSISLDDDTKLISITAPDTLDVYYVVEPVGETMVPSTSSTKYDGNPFASEINGTVKAICAKEGYVNSSIASRSLNDWFRLADVVYEPGFVDVDGVRTYSVSLSHEVEGVDIRYYVSNNYYYEETPAKLLYDGNPVPVELGQYVHARASKAGQVDSEWTYFRVTTSALKVNRPSVKYYDSETKTLVVTTTTANANVYYYTVDKDDNILTEAVKMTKDTLVLERNDYFRFYATKDKMATSDTLSYSVTDWFRVPNVQFEPYAVGDSLKMRLTCEDPNATIYYDFDDFNSSNLPANVLYKEPFTVENSKYVYASAARDGFNNANTTNTYIRYSSYTCSSPTITISSADQGVTITAEEGSTIYYTLDGSDPTVNSTKYVSKFTLTENHTIRAIATAAGKINSSISEKTYSSFRVSEVVISPFVEDNKLKIKLETSTPGAKIYYAINETNSEVTSNIVYTAPFEVTDGTYVYANAVKDNFNNAGWSSFGWIYLSNYTCNQPTITIKADTTVVMSANEGATIYYTLDGTEPSASSTKYTAEFKLTHNVDIRAIAMEEGKIPSSVRERTYNGFYTASPEFSVDGVKMTITSATPNATIKYAYEVDPRDETTGSIVYSRTYSGPFDLLYNGYVYVRVEKENFQSNSGEYWVNGLVRWQKPEVLLNNGHALKFKEIEGATIWYTTNGDYPGQGYYNSVEYKDSIVLTGTGTIRAMAQGSYRNDSEVAEIPINSYAGENGATSEKAGGLATSMGWSTPSTIKEFTITGPINSDDISYIKDNMTSLEKLDLSATTVDDGNLPANAFAGMPLITFSSPNGLQTVGKNIFSNCKNLAAVVWNTTAKIPNDAFDADVNQNLLLFVPSQEAAPDNSSVRNIIVNGTAQNIYLGDGENNNFYCPQQFYTQSITYTHDFTLETGDGSGWETIALPFNCSRFVHESKGELKPFAAYNNLDDKASYKPFWLRELTDIGFNDVSQIEANKPYIISMPNNESYATRYRVGGKVTFSATDTWVPVTEPQAVQKGVNTLYANFLNDSDTDHMLLLNTEDTDEHKAGSIFVKNSGRAVRPFEAYVLSQANARAYISITRGFGDDPDGDEGTTAIKVVEPDANGLVKVYNLSGVLVKQGAKEDVLRGLAKGVYIMNGKSVVVK